MMLYILPNQAEIYSSLRIYVIMSYHIETNNKGSEEFLYITSIVSGQKLILEKLPIFSSELYYTTMRTVEANVAIHQKCSDPKVFML